MGWSFTNLHILCVYEKSKKATSKPLQAMHVVSYILDTGEMNKRIIIRNYNFGLQYSQRHSM